MNSNKKFLFNDGKIRLGVKFIILITGKIHERFAAELIDCLAGQMDKNIDFENLLLAAECLQNLRTRSSIRETDKKTA